MGARPAAFGRDVVLQVHLSGSGGVAEDFPDTHDVSLLRPGTAVIGPANPRGPLITTLGSIAVAASSVNVVGDFMITNRMLRMFRTGNGRPSDTARKANTDA
jgi:hypothetical protein